jgi:hypothetical protein
MQNHISLIKQVLLIGTTKLACQNFYRFQYRWLCYILLVLLPLVFYIADFPTALPPLETRENSVSCLEPFCSVFMLNYFAAFFYAFPRAPVNDFAPSRKMYVIFFIIEGMHCK